MLKNLVKVTVIIVRHGEEWKKNALFIKLHNVIKLESVFDALFILMCSIPRNKAAGNAFYLISLVI